jgi:hypothetical protein
MIFNVVKIIESLFEFKNIIAIPLYSFLLFVFLDNEKYYDFTSQKRGIRPPKSISISTSNRGQSVQLLPWVFIIDTEIDRIVYSFNQEKIFLFSMSKHGSRNFYNK